MSDYAEQRQRYIKWRNNTGVPRNKMKVRNVIIRWSIYADNYRKDIYDIVDNWPNRKVTLPRYE